MAVTLFGVVVSLANAVLAQEPARFALLIGNQGYSSAVGPLKNTHNDIKLVGEALKKLKFEVTVIPDAGYRKMDIAIRRHVARVRGAGAGTVSFFYYSGHGVANPDTGNNYLVPVDVERADTESIWYESFEQSVLIDRLNRQAPRAIHFVVLDACRDELNLTSGGKKSLGTEKGFRPVGDVRGMLIAYATAERKTAADTGDFARILAEEIVKPGIEAVSAFRNVQLRVEETLGQEPWMSLRYLPKTYLAGKETAPPPRTTPQPPLSDATPLTYQRYVESFEAGQPILRDMGFTIEEMGQQHFSIFERATARLQGTKWQGGTSWGEVTFADNGRRAEYTNDGGGAPGQILLTGLLGDSNNSSGATRSIIIDPILIGEWRQNDGHGALILKFESGQLKLLWGPRFLRESVWSAHMGDVRNREPASSCDGVSVSLGTGGTECVVPGSGESFRDCPDCPEMVVAPSGSFDLGSPRGEEGRYEDEDDTPGDGGKPVKVTIAEPFAVGKFEVTRGEFAEFVSSSGHKAEDCRVRTGSEWKTDSSKSWRDPGFTQDADHPVVCVNWNDATAYAAWLSRKTGQEYRLLTEAEWEYASRAGTQSPFWWSSSISPAQANYDGNFTYGTGQKGEYRQKTVPVKSFEANPWGLYQVHGNVLEWVQDCYVASYKDAPSDGSTAKDTSGCARVLRGGSWFSYPFRLRSAFRVRFTPGFRAFSFGFRVARTL